ncbi:hypothetical protein [Pontixanthobacter sp.]|uniref:hypothetical protein n=1 Tax=Pontixanthobacter sp. TaxID=2792078 RepID=UPI003C7B8D7B
MARYKPLEGHPLIEILNSLLKFEGRKELGQEHFGIQPPHVYAIDRIFSVARSTQLSLSKLGGEPINISALNDLENAFSNVQNELNAFISNGNAAHIDNARTHIDHTATPSLRNLLPIGFEVHPRTEAALESYRKKARDANSELKNRTSELNDKLEKLLETIGAESEKLVSFSAEIQERKAENDTAISDLKKSDIARVEKQTNDAQATLAEVERQLADFVKKKEKSLQSALQGFRNSGKSLVGDLEAKKDEASGIVQSVGDLLTTGTYADRASKETGKADFFRTVTVGLFAFGLLIIVSNYMIYAFGIAFSKEVVLAESWQSLVARVATGLAVTLPAFYTARESARHRTNADIAKQRELELTTLGPFIELLPNDQKSAIRDRLTDRYFGGEIEPHNVKAPIDVDALIKAITDAAKVSKDGTN